MGNNVELIIAIISFATSIIAAIVTYVFNKRMQIINEIRQMKIKAYSQYIEALAKFAQNPTDHNLLEHYAIETNSVCLVASADAINAIQELNEYIMRKDNCISIDEQNKLVTNMYTALRADLKMYKKSDDKIDKVILYRG